MIYDFDKPIDRRGSGDLKHEVLEERYGRSDLLPLWVADMDWETPSFITDALKQRLEHSLFGYTVEPKDYWPTVQQWIETHHQWKVEREWITYIPGIVKGIGMVINFFLKPDEKVIVQPPVYHPFPLSYQATVPSRFRLGIKFFPFFLLFFLFICIFAPEKAKLFLLWQRKHLKKRRKHA